MYESFFRLKTRPFAAAPMTHNYYPGEAIEQARQTCIRAVERAEGPALVIGPAGVGKTLLCRLLAAYFESVFEVALLSNTQIRTDKALLQNILFELGLPYRAMDDGELRLQLINHLQSNDECPNGVLLLFDEAHTLPLRLLEELRVLTNVVRNGQPRVRLVLAGNSRLDERFANPKLESFNQRVAARCYLQAMSRGETDDYIRSQFSFAGGSADLILAEDAFRAVFQATDGIPRLVNQVCNHALTISCQGGCRRVDASKVEEAWADLQQLPTPWHEKKVETDNQHAVIEFGQLDDDLNPLNPPTTDPVISTVERCGAAIEFLTSGEMGESPSIVFGTMGPDIETAQGFEFPTDGEGELNDSPHPAPVEQLEIAPAVNPFETPFAEEEIVVDRVVSLREATPAISVRANEAESVETFLSETLASEPFDGNANEEEPPLAEPTEEEPIECVAEPAPAEDDVECVPGAELEYDPADAAWNELLTILPTGSGGFDPADGSLAGMFEITVIETAPGEGMVLDTTPNVGQPASRGAGASADEHARSCVPFAAPRAASDDRDLIQLQDDEETAESKPECVHGDARRMEYRELFAQLRRRS